MKNYEFEDIYYSLLVEMRTPHAVPGGECDRLYNEAMDAYERLCARLNKPGEDPDVEVVINNLLSIQRILCEKTFHYGRLLR